MAVTSMASAVLEVEGADHALLKLKADSDNSAFLNAAIQLYNNGNATATWAFGLDENNSDAWTLSNGSVLSSNPRLTVTTAGNVGIGTNAPSKQT